MQAAGEIVAKGHRIVPASAQSNRHIGDEIDRSWQAFPIFGAKPCVHDRLGTVL
jgi:hypothetical protein